MMISVDAPSAKSGTTDHVELAIAALSFCQHMISSVAISTHLVTWSI
jgi:hypothetical protein